MESTPTTMATMYTMTPKVVDPCPAWTKRAGRIVTAEKYVVVIGDNDDFDELDSDDGAGVVVVLVVVVEVTNISPTTFFCGSIVVVRRDE